jgi:hypothetical protein
VLSNCAINQPTPQQEMDNINKDIIWMASVTPVGAHGWGILLFQQPFFIYSLIFYTLLSVLVRHLVKLIWPHDNDIEALAGGFPSNQRKRDTIGTLSALPARLLPFLLIVVMIILHAHVYADGVGRWTPSLTHATIGSIGSLLICGSFISDTTMSKVDISMHTLGYFLADLVIAFTRGMYTYIMLLYPAS